MYAISRTFSDGTVRLSNYILPSEYDAQEELKRVKKHNAGIKCKVVKLIDWIE